MPEKFQRHASRNIEFENCIHEHFPDDYYDWKIVALFYSAFHLLQALAAKRKIKLGANHHDINRAINPDFRNSDKKMPVSLTAYNNYIALFSYIHSARYDGFDDPDDFELINKSSYAHAKKLHSDFSKYCLDGLKSKSLQKEAR